MIDLASILAWMYAHALLVGVGLIVAGGLVRLLGRAFSYGVLAAGLLVTASVAWGQWQSAHSLLATGTVLLIGLAIAGLVAWVIRAVSFFAALALFGGGWYLLLFSQMGAAFLTTSVGLGTWVALVILGMVITEHVGRRIHHAAVVPTLAAGAA